jgi:hypothetical protein
VRVVFSGDAADFGDAILFSLGGAIYLSSRRGIVVLGSADGHVVGGVHPAGPARLVLVLRADAQLHDEILGILITTWSTLAGSDDHELSDREEAARLLRDAAQLHEIAAAACALPLPARRAA